MQRRPPGLLAGACTHAGTAQPSGRVPRRPGARKARPGARAQPGGPWAPRRSQSDAGVPTRQIEKSRAPAGAGRRSWATAEAPGDVQRSSKGALAGQATKAPRNENKAGRLKRLCSCCVKVRANAASWGRTMPERGPLQLACTFTNTGTRLRRADLAPRDPPPHRRRRRRAASLPLCAITSRTDRAALTHQVGHGNTYILEAGWETKTSGACQAERASGARSGGAQNASKISRQIVH